jgi:prolyl oligopeptidase
VLIVDYEQLLTGTAEPRVVFDPDGEEFLAAGVFAGDRFLSLKLRDVATVVEVVTPGAWTFEPLKGVPENATVRLAAFDPLSDEMFITATGFDRPPQLLHGTPTGGVCEIKSSPAFFDADDLVVTQHFSTSADGTRVPYFLLAHRNSDGPGPVLLDGTALSGPRNCRATWVHWDARGCPAAAATQW